MPEEWKTKQRMVEKRRRKYTFAVKTEKKTECGTQNTEAKAKRGEQKSGECETAAGKNICVHEVQ